MLGLTELTTMKGLEVTKAVWWGRKWVETARVQLWWPGVLVKEKKVLEEKDCGHTP